MIPPAAHELIEKLQADLTSARDNIKAVHDAFDAQPWATDEPVRVQLDRITRELSDSRELTKKYWIELCARRLIEKSNLERPVAEQVAASQLENLNNDLSEDPVEAADEEMSNWTD